MIDSFSSVPPHHLPDFPRLTAGDFEPAFDSAMAAHRAEIDAIAGAAEPPSFDNTLAALERSGERLGQVARTFGVLAGAHTNPALQAVEREVAPKLSRHGSAISMNPALFARIDDLFARREALGLSPEDLRLLERTHSGFVRSGARLEGEARDRLAAINAELSVLGTRFSQNLLADESAWELPLSSDDLAGLPDDLVSTLAAAAEARGRTGHVLTLARSHVVPFLTYSTRRDLRETAFAAWTKRGENEGETDNRPIMAEILKLRAEKARLLGFDSYAAFKLDDTMAKTPSSVRGLLEEVWAEAKARAARDAEALGALARAEGHNGAVEPHDWRFLAEKRRRAEFDMDESELKSYLVLDRMIEAAFDVAGRLFGLTFEEVFDAPLWHEDVRAWRVRGADGETRGLFLGDYFARPSKRSGAWMSSLRPQNRMRGETPIIYNVCNFAKPAAGSPALLSIDDARTLFHEFGHALHGLLSDVTWPSLSGTAVSRDFVELPSQLYEHWLTVPEVLSRHALHARTGEPLPAELTEKLNLTRTFDAGFDTVEYTASALVDLALHEGAEPAADVGRAEAEELARIGMPREIVMRHRSPHFAHVFSGEGYSAGYYSYLWSEVLDADAFEAFREAGDPFDRATADKLLANIYAAGNSRDAAELYTAFRGRMPSTAALLRKRGFAT
ncbi:M3 family metallopeptidase [Antarcticirhabdus aurantiaca]|uniref:M3 family metallopeptidase n=1 Tax=Antarcticirhabdus aurantiaca TaxID=2606717 RepID=A0ACD4NLP8_9HYPH|nr:M3 family metallopeptidase [Antarcticirhabdus aurantiaca]WAJ27783.1 M3 family metallopeptidase [Jeongeuplla avenae]